MFDSFVPGSRERDEAENCKTERDASKRDVEPGHRLGVTHDNGVLPGGEWNAAHNEIGAMEGFFFSIH